MHNTSIRRSFAIGAISAILTLGAAATADAATPPSDTAMAAVTTDGGSRVVHESGTGPDLISPAAATSRLVGGGTWNYNSFTDSGRKYCWSEYTHPTKRHSASAKMGNTTRKSTANAGRRALASVNSGNTKLTCYAYWNTY
ncbi:lactococcin 972 family bacteriocin [Actinomyces ruminicola]|uniref:lactococcin 972 family bacteriocin n=1 Tax=Actinomyces ruminicola TaxID=332524 RepID=UPI0011C86230|nr:lactococcin 972 family bacteriocin [Actinomyces ruminicola]